MDDKVKETIRLFFEGHPGHHGNVLGHALIVKLHKFINVMSKMERRFEGLKTRQTEYEVVWVGKNNPTGFEFRPVSRVPAYDPLLAFNLSVEQIEAIAEGRNVDEHVDAEIANDLRELATKGKEDDYTRFWAETQDATVKFDETFAYNAQYCANRLRIRDRPQSWRSTVSVGSVKGRLSAVDDISGHRQFVIEPAVGPELIECTFPEDKRGVMNDSLFSQVQVRGRLHYREDSPFPYLIEMTDMTVLRQPYRHLLDMRGAFRGFGEPPQDISFLNA